MKKTVIITGANRGLGKAFVDVLMTIDDCFIISLSRSVSKDQEEFSSKKFQFIKTVLSKNDIQNSLKMLKNTISNEAIYFINNASLIEPIIKIEDIDEASIDDILSVNIKSTMLITSFLLKNYDSNQVTFVNISSGAANRPISNWSLYCSSKACIEMFFKVAETEYQQHRFFNINPGVMDTNMQKSIRESDFPDVENFKSFQKEGKLKNPIDVAKDILKTIQIIE
ncbi:SDR family NAD(P)-dependent oxidoreductase [Polaribacter sp. BAL334]|uniref:SDR family NAD(P)-dependent oxidoreductase n=1 Tax=Polaribacter sp. BAL334 TaxID=1708178 RepID=UPI0018D25B4F|nr:SDR family NAD(P)-dependent oxidoreductase [Polaribacter sp. BAL334]MBG7612796.1 SDR family NAD(P)-dependent oxidoreductase [Polaribacter sp. BAL334]